MLKINRFLVIRLALLLLLVSSLAATAQVDEDQLHAELIETFRLVQDDEMITSAWRAMQAVMTDAEVKAALVGIDTDDGTLRADLALISVDLDLMPTGREGPGDFLWVRLAAAMQRDVQASSDNPYIDGCEHWHVGSLNITRSFWPFASANGTNGTALYHLVALNNVGKHPQVLNDGIPFEEHSWSQFTAIEIARRVLDMDSPYIFDFPQADVSWSDRGFIWLVNELVQPGWKRSSQDELRQQAFQLMLRGVADSDVSHSWLGGFVIAPPDWETDFLDIPGQSAWIPLASPREAPPVGPEMPPEMDWDQWVGRGVCMVRVHRRAQWGWREYEQALVDALGLPALVVVPNQVYVRSDELMETEADVFLFLPNVRPMGFGRFDLPSVEVD